MIDFFSASVGQVLWILVFGAQEDDVLFIWLAAFFVITSVGAMAGGQSIGLGIMKLVSRGWMAAR